MKVCLAKMLKQPIIRDEKHRRFISELPCMICATSPCQAAHIRHGFYAMGMKPGDDLTVPLCPPHHAAQHQMNEQEFWQRQGYPNIKDIARTLYKQTGEHEIAEKLLHQARINGRIYTEVG
jgi:hypothetical protein